MTPFSGVTLSSATCYPTVTRLVYRKRLYVQIVRNFSVPQPEVIPAVQVMPACEYLAIQLLLRPPLLPVQPQCPFCCVQVYVITPISFFQGVVPKHLSSSFSI